MLCLVNDAEFTSRNKADFTQYFHVKIINTANVEAHTVITAAFMMCVYPA